MPLLKQSQDQEASNPPMDPDNGETGGEGFDSSQIEGPIMDQLQGQAKADVERVVTEGSKFIFSEQAMPQIFGAIRPEDEVPLTDELGAAAVNIMKILVDKSGGTMPGEAIIPAGTILLARAGEFINEQGLGEVTYDVFAEAEKIFSEVIVEEARKTEGQADQIREATGQQAPQPAPQGGLLNRGVA